MQVHYWCAGLLVAALCGPTAKLGAQQEPPPRRDSTRTYTLTPIAVEGRINDLTGIALTASQGLVGIEDLRLRPLTREGEVLEVVPGMILTQHSGDGKSNQMFVRGFNLDHGTDFSTSVEGMPVNMPTHGHGQGYTDLNFITPELVDHIEYKLGVYYPELGDFGSAGGAQIRLATELATPLLKLEAGANNFMRGVAAGSATVGAGNLLVGGELKAYDGPWTRPQDLQKWSGLGRYTWESGGNEFSILAMTYGNEWNASDQIPRRAVADGSIDRFGQIDSTLGGRSRRHSLSAQWSRSDSNGGLRIDAYGIVSRLDLFSNFTYFLDNPGMGDQIEQQDDRVVAGLNGEVLRFVSAFGKTHGVRAGFQGRYDNIEPALFRATDRERTSTVRADRVGEWAGGVYVAAESRWTDKVRTVLGLRADGYSFSVVSKRPENSGDRTDAIVTPKVNLVLGPWSGWEFYAGAGSGFHSNDARGTTITTDPVTGDAVDPVDPLVRSRGAEIGVRASPPSSGLRSTVSLWWLDLDSELLFVGDAGTTEPSGKTRRVGVTWANYWRALPQLSLDFDLSLTRARAVDEASGEDLVPGALENVIAAGITYEPLADGPFLTARVRHLGPHPLIEDNSVRGESTTLVNASVGWIFRRARATVSLLNVLDSDDADIQYFYASRGPGEAVDGIEDLHFHPVEPRQVRFALSWGF